MYARTALSALYMALLASNWTGAELRTRGGVTQITRVVRPVRKCASRQTRHRSAISGLRQHTEGYKPLDSTQYHKGCACVASALMCTVAARGLAKLHTLYEAGMAVWVLIGAFLLAGGFSMKK